MTTALGRMVSPEEALGWVGKFEDDGALSLTRHSLSLVHTVVVQAEQIAAVLALHRPIKYEPGEEAWCDICLDQPYPCQTAIDLGVTEQ